MIANSASRKDAELDFVLSTSEARPRERSDRIRFFAYGQKSLFIPGFVQGAIV